MFKSEQRHLTHKGLVICISGASNDCLVWIDDKPVLGLDRRFKSLHRARIAARAYIDRHA